jgi:hypothetical protein
MHQKTNKKQFFEDQHGFIYSYIPNRLVQFN